MRNRHANQMAER